MFKKKVVSGFKYLAIILGIAGLIFAGVWVYILYSHIRTPAPDTSAKYQPILNPHPRYFMTVKGHIDSVLRDKVHLKWMATYYSTNPKCDYFVNKFEGVKTYRKKIVTIHVKPNKSGNYVYKFALDRYRLGFCGWKVLLISYGVENLNMEKNSIALFSRKGNKKMVSAGNDFICSSNMLCRFVYHKKFYSFLSRFSDYLYILNFRGKS